MSRRGGNRIRAREDGWDGWGGYMNAKRQKLKEQFEKETPQQLKKEGSGSKIFKGITIHVNGYTKPSSDELKRLMMLHGGSYEHYLYRTRVTHVIATNLPDSKVRELKGLKVVRPEWITESIAAGKLLSYTNYLLYTAKSGLQTGLRGFSVNHTGNQSGDVTATSEGPSLSSSTSVHTINKTYSSKDINLSSSELQTKDTHDLQKCDSTEMNQKVVEPPRKQDGSYTNGHSHSSTSTSPAKAGDPNFLNEFYSNSRLHFLSTWKAEFKSYVNELQKQGSSFPGREKLRKVVADREMSSVDTEYCNGVGKPKRCVMHIDMDCFFVSVGLRNRPDLKGKPVAVTHSKGKGTVPDSESDLFYEKMQWDRGRMKGSKKGKKSAANPSQLAVIGEDLGFPDKSDSDSESDSEASNRNMPNTFHSFAEIASCSYEARQRGVKNGMFMGKAKTICPELVTIPYDFEQYKAVSKTLYDTVASYSHDIEAVSCDEMLVDCTELLANTGATPSEFATLLRAEILSKTGCCASAGLASNILLAKMATRKAKPNGQFHLPTDTVHEFLRPQSVKDIPGVGWSLTKRFEAMNVFTCGDLQKVSMETLQREFGPKTGQSLYRYCRGEDDRPVKIEQQRKSVSAEINYGIRFERDSEAHKFIQELSEEVCSRLHNIQMKGKTITLKLMIRREDAPKATCKFMGHGICNNFSKSVTLPMATDDPKVVGQECLSILKQQKCVASDLRGIGIQVQRLESAMIGNQQSLSKNLSILNFTVNKTEKAERIQSEKSLKTESKPHRNPSKTMKGLDESKDGNVSRPWTFNDNQRKDDGTSGQAMKIENKMNRNQHKMIKSLAEGGNSVEELHKSKVHQPENCVTNGKLSEDIEKVSIKDPKNDVEEGMNKNLSGDVLSEQNGPESSDLLKDLGQRQVLSSQLPPLPCLPELRSPDSHQTSTTNVNTPETASVIPPNLQVERDMQHEDYFPSPSQIDPEVLRELPQDIRLQVEKEIESRKKSTSVRNHGSGPGCSHWQECSRDQYEDIVESISEAPQLKPSIVESDIVPLPSSSQLDISCLNALPESLQNEIRQAYAMQAQKTCSSSSAVSVMKPKSPSKSPNKRSPAKRSPHFKVPKGRPSTRGRKKGSSKKLVFKDQQKFVPEEKGINYTDQDGDKLQVASKHTETSLGTSEGNSAANLESRTVENITTDRSGLVEEGAINKTVNLCGAVKIVEVRSLIKEWISSTPVPQAEDEEVFLEYIHALVRDKNLEQVDLVLKTLCRNIDRTDNTDWFMALTRISSQTQSIVKEYHGYSLGSITV